MNSVHSRHTRSQTSHTFHERIYGFNRFTTRRNERLIDLITAVRAGPGTSESTRTLASVSILGARDVERGR